MWTNAISGQTQGGGPSKTSKTKTNRPKVENSPTKNSEKGNNPPRRSGSGCGKSSVRTCKPKSSASDDVASMGAAGIKKELENHGISTKHFLEKSELVDALVKARADKYTFRKPAGSRSKPTEDDSPMKLPKQASPKPAASGQKPAASSLRRNVNQKISKSSAQNRQHHSTHTPENEDPYLRADPSKWRYMDLEFEGSYSGVKLGKEENVKGKSIKEAMEMFRKKPKKYVALTYQTKALDWNVAQQEYNLIHRKNTENFQADLVPNGWMTLLLHKYEALPSFKNDVLPKEHHDKYTDTIKWNNRIIHSSNNKFLLPGRGMGVADTPNIKIIGDVDPSDICQGFVGDCWLLSGISSLAEFDGAVKRLFRKTPKLHQRPLTTPNTYTITLWDLTKWKEVDIVIDERLCSKPGGTCQLLGAKPSEDGELWVCYLEKALAVHCGGWDKITGGQCTHAWALMTGCKEQYSIRINPKSGKFACFAKFDMDQGKWAKHGNSPHDSDKRMWRVGWPEVGGGGNHEIELDQEELFMRMCAWDDVNYIVGAGIRNSAAAGLVDDHAYSVIECLNDVAGTDVDLIKVRNPWGKGEIEDGLFDDDGPGWDKYPQIKAELKPVVADDGIFWVTKQEFFEFFGTIFLSASNMTDFLED